MISIVELIRMEGREPGGIPSTTVWAGKWGEKLKLQTLQWPEKGKLIKGLVARYAVKVKK